MKFNWKILTLFIIFNGSVLSMAIIDSNSNNQTLICLIKNLKYQGEYLYSTFDVDEMRHRRVYSNKLDSNLMQHSDQLLWILKPASWLNDTFYITNYFYNEHLCAHHTHLEKFNYRRYVYLVKMNKESLFTNQKCLWKLKLLQQLNNSYTIWNLNYKEPLYAASFMLKTAKTDRRNLFLWHKKPDSRQFNWNLECISHY
jgi:hypothetical protein